HHFLFFSILLPTPSSTLFPYTTLFRSQCFLALRKRLESQSCCFLLWAWAHRSPSRKALIPPLFSNPPPIRGPPTTATTRAGASARSTRSTPPTSSLLRSPGFIPHAKSLNPLLSK